ncbi:hypothetical protein ACUNV4_28015 [Granulosicoccus sp. 3-233]|uniref:hypothetical protein n=1 Tax=Granulosicoccus sp. 3-233 TaxID=3417969 RepID=UPI003D3444B4
MEWLEGALATLGGGTVLVGATTAVVRYLLDRHVNREMAVFKAEMATENAIVLERLKAEIAQQGRLDERRHEYAQVMRRYEGPLQHAVYDLQSRLYNVVSQGFIQTYYLKGDEHEKQYVVDNTAYVIAQYFAWSEIIRTEIHFIECSTSGNTKALTTLQNQIYSLWQTDAFRGPLRIWAGEQRAIGESMVEERGNRLTCIGYARFLELVETEEVALLNSLRSDVASACTDIVSCFPRLVAVQHALIDLLCFLDPDSLRFPADTRTYVGAVSDGS